MSTEVRVDPAVLDAAATAAAHLRDGVRGGLTDVEPETALAARELAGWQTGRSLDALLHWWREDLSRLVERLDDMSEGLRRCAADYRRADHTSAGNFQALD